MDKCIECDRESTKYTCITCARHICQICSIKASESDQGYSEENKTLGWCNECTKSNKKRSLVETINVENVTAKKAKFSQKKVIDFFGGSKKKAVESNTTKSGKKSTLRTLTTATAQKWIDTTLVEYDAIHWFKYEEDGGLAVNLKCEVSFL